MFVPKQWKTFVVGGWKGKCGIDESCEVRLPHNCDELLSWPKGETLYILRSCIVFMGYNIWVSSSTWWVTTKGCLPFGVTLKLAYAHPSRGSWENSPLICTSEHKIWYDFRWKLRIFFLNYSIWYNGWGRKCDKCEGKF